MPFLLDVIILSVLIISLLPHYSNPFHYSCYYYYCCCYYYCYSPHFSLSAPILPLIQQHSYPLLSTFSACTPGRIKRGDILVAINGFYLTDMSFNDVISLLKVQNSPFIYLRFLRWSYYEERNEGTDVIKKMFSMIYSVGFNILILFFFTFILVFDSPLIQLIFIHLL